METNKSGTAPLRVDAVLQELQDAAALSLRKPVRPEICASICSAVANLVAGAGRHGGTEQKNLMDRCARFGFHPEYYADSIRVHYYPKEQA
jgi:hypothetical protein